MNLASNTQRQAVTGAFGFSGAVIAEKLLAAGQELVTLTSSIKRSSPLQGRVKVYPFDFARPEQMAESLAGVQVLYNTYWTRLNKGETTHQEAVQNSLALFEAARLAGVQRVVHISVANAEKAPDLSYYRAKKEVEDALAASGLAYAVLRPAMLFGPGGILLNNIVWALRKLPLFSIFGDGLYKLCPIYVGDLADLAIEQGNGSRNVTIDAMGPDVFTYKELVRLVGESIGYSRPMLRMPVWAGLAGAWFIGKTHGDVFASPEEVKALMRGLLDVPGAKSQGKLKLVDWLATESASLGLRYLSEVGRRKDKGQAYWKP